MSLAEVRQKQEVDRLAAPGGRYAGTAAVAERPWAKLSLDEQKQAARRFDVQDDEERMVRRSRSSASHDWAPRGSRNDI